MLQAQRIFPLIDLLGIVPVDHVGGVPVGVFLGETSDQRIVISCSQIIQACLRVVILTAVTEGVGIIFIQSTLVTECVVIVVFGQLSVSVG